MRTTFGEHAPNFAASMKDLALLYQALGSYGRVERLFRHAMEICRQVPGDEVGFARSLNDRAGLYDLMLV
jgi:hypothetical protein